MCQKSISLLTDSGVQRGNFRKRNNETQLVSVVNHRLCYALSKIIHMWGEKLGNVK